MKRHPSRLPPAAGALLAAALAVLPAAPARAKVTFTGYGNFVLTADSHIRLRGPSSVLGSIPEGNLIARGFDADAVGLFATTRVGEESEFLVDLTYRDLGSAGGHTRIQYAYLDAALPWWELRLQAGKVSLPFNYYNTRRFYPFQRVELSGPLFVSAILGLPIADAGAVLARRFPLDGDWGVDARVYAVNGYGSLSGSTAALRSPSVPGGLTMSGNLGNSNNNKDIAMGGQLAVGSPETGELGASYYRGAWDREGRRILQMAGAHAFWTPGGFDLLAEYLHLHVTGDEGMIPSLGGSRWATHGAFVTASHPLFRVAEREVRGWLHFENYRSARVGGGDGREVVRAYSGGINSRVNDNVTLKLEGQYVYYGVPAPAKSIVLDGRLVQAAAVITF